jgi:hypothetical protein
MAEEKLSTANNTQDNAKLNDLEPNRRYDEGEFLTTTMA